MQAMATNQFFSSWYGGDKLRPRRRELYPREVALLARGWKYDGTEWIGYAFGVLFAFILFFRALTWLTQNQHPLRPGRLCGD